MLFIDLRLLSEYVFGVKMGCLAHMLAATLNLLWVLDAGTILGMESFTSCPQLFLVANLGVCLMITRQGVTYPSSMLRSPYPPCF